MPHMTANGFDPDARMAQIIGQPERIVPMAEEELSEEARQIGANVRTAFGLTSKGSAPGFFRIAAKHPGLYKAQMDMGVQLIKHGTVPARERELAILRNAWLCGAPYEWGEHVDIGRNRGVAPDEVARCTIGSSAPGWQPFDRAVIRAVEELHEDKCVGDDTWAVLSAKWNEQQLMEFIVLIGQYISTALLQNSLRVRLMDDNPGLNYR